MFIGNNTNKSAFRTGRLITIYKQKNYSFIFGNSKP